MWFRAGHVLTVVNVAHHMIHPLAAAHSAPVAAAPTAAIAPAPVAAAAVAVVTAAPPLLLASPAPLPLPPLLLLLLLLLAFPSSRCRSILRHRRHPRLRQQTGLHTKEKATYALSS